MCEPVSEKSMWGIRSTKTKTHTHTHTHTHTVGGQQYAEDDSRVPAQHRARQAAAHCHVQATLFAPPE
jgi:hypothetical protein